MCAANLNKVGKTTKLFLLTLFKYYRVTIITKRFSIKYNDNKVNIHKCASQNEVTVKSVFNLLGEMS